MKCYVGVDGGGSRTRVVLVDEKGCERARQEAGPSNLHHVPEKEVQAHLQQALEAAWAQAGVKASHCVSMFLGMAGVTSPETAARFADLGRACGLRDALLGVDHDIRIALAGGLAGQPGIALIVGTGSSCYGRTRDGRTWQTGGWGALLADEGSGYDLARQAMVAAVRMADGRQQETPLRAKVFSWLSIESVRDILKRIHESGLSRSEIAAFAPVVVASAEEGDEAAQAILDQGAHRLAEMVAANHARLPTGPGPDLVITGGLGMSCLPYRKRLASSIRARLENVTIHHPRFSPVLGAAMLAMEQDGLALSPAALHNLSQSPHESSLPPPAT